MALVSGGEGLCPAAPEFSEIALALTFANQHALTSRYVGRSRALAHMERHNLG